MDILSGSIFDFIPIDVVADREGEKRFSLLTAPAVARLPVPSLELLFALTLLRPMNANSFMDCRAILETRELDTASLLALGRRSPGIRRILAARLSELARHLKAQAPVLAGKCVPALAEASRKLKYPTQVGRSKK